MQVTNKVAGRGFDPVTLADQAGERVIRAAIESAYPDHGIFGEEFGLKPGNGLTWVIDPIDGTRAFMTGMLHWGVLLALFDGEQPIVGVMYQPYTDELFSGDNELARYERAGQSQSLVTSACEQVDERAYPRRNRLVAGHRARALCAAQSSDQTDKDGWRLLSVWYAGHGFVGPRRRGRVKPYDIQALMPIVRGAGGIVTSWDGGNPSLGGTVLASATASVACRGHGIVG